MGRDVLTVIVAGLAVASAACGGAEAGGLDEVDAGTVEVAEAELDLPRPPPGEARGTYKLTYYWVSAEAAYDGTATEPIYDRQCEVLARVSPAYARSLRLEGTGRLADGRLVNVAGECDCPGSLCYLEAGDQHPWGYGVQNRALVPYRSVAVDRAVVPYGTHLYLAELDGVEVPGEAPWGGFVHDGCVIAADTGGSIDGAHLDWFVGLRSSYRSLDSALRLTRATVHDGGDRCPAS